MCRLAAPSCPPSGFWTESPKFRENSTIQYVGSCNPIYTNTVHLARINNIKTTPLTWNSLLKPELDNVPFTPKLPHSLLTSTNWFCFLISLCGTYQYQNPSAKVPPQFPGLSPSLITLPLSHLFLS